MKELARFENSLTGFVKGQIKTFTVKSLDIGTCMSEQTV